MVLYGWVAHKRLDRFLVLRDAYGSIQVRVPDNREDLVEKVKPLTCESVLKVDGVVADRGQKHRNPRMETGDVEVKILYSALQKKLAMFCHQTITRLANIVSFC